MNLNSRTFLMLSAFYCIVLCLLYYVCFLIQCGNNITAAWWLRDSFEYKQYLSRIIPSPKIIIMGGSNALFGINSKVIEDITGYNVVNFASHAGLDINFFYLKIKEYMNDGDIIVMPLEYEYYFYDDKQTQWFTDNMMAWGQEDYLSKIGFVELIKFIFHVPKQQIYEGILKREKKNQLVDKDIIIDNIANSIYSGWHGYSYKSLNKHGDINLDAEPTNTLLTIKKKGVHYIEKGSPSKHFLKFFTKISKFVEQRHGKLILTWPTSMINKDFDLSKGNHLKGVSEFVDNLGKDSITIACDPLLFNMEIQYFFDTKYHLNKKGAYIRSEHLARCINDLL